MAKGSVVERNNVQVRGAVGGTPIVFAHGFGCDQEMWRLLTPAFEDEYQVVVYDHVGFGGSDFAAWNPDRHRHLGTYADELLEIIAELGLSDVILVGHSVASMIGLLACLAAPQRFSHLVMVGPSPRYLDDVETGYVGGFSRADIDGLLAALDDNYFGWSSTLAPVIMGNDDRPALAAELRESFCRTRPEVAASFARATFLADNRSDLGRLMVPTLVLQCANDAIAPDAVGQYVAENIAGASFVRLEASGHCPNLSAPEETARAIKDYLRRATRG